MYIPSKVPALEFRLFNIEELSDGDTFLTTLCNSQGEILIRFA
jgi:hypothetical protein